MANEIQTLPQLLSMKAVQEKFVELLGKNSASFISSLVTIWNDDEKLRKCDPVTILSAAKQAAILQLPIMKQLGYSYVIPYYDGRAKKYVAQFQLGYKGLLQLAMRSGVFRNLNTVAIYDGQIKKVDYLTGEIEIGERTSDEVVGYAAYMELTNGFRKTLYMTREEMELHAQTYSDSYRADKEKKWSVWAKNFDAMAKKTVLKKMLNTYAPTSIEMQQSSLVTAMQADQSVITPNGYQYVDNIGVESQPELETIDAETGEIKEEEIEVPFD